MALASFGRRGGWEYEPFSDKKESEKEAPIEIHLEGRIVNYIVKTQGWSGIKITECETAEEAWEALGDCSIGALTEVRSPTGKSVSELVPF